MAAFGKGGGAQSDGLIPRRTGLFACLCALASFDAFADPYAQAFAAIFFGIGAGFLACIVVELAAGRGGWLKRAAVGVAFTILDAAAYLVFINILITVAVASGPSTSASGPGPVILVTLAAWVVPALRLAWLLRTRRPTNT
jgi:hypothetical protein